MKGYLNKNVNDVMEEATEGMERAFQMERHEEGHENSEKESDVTWFIFSKSSWRSTGFMGGGDSGDGDSSLGEDDTRTGGILRDYNQCPDDRRCWF